MATTGHITAVTGSIAEVTFPDGVPGRREVVLTDGAIPAQLEVIASASSNSVYCLVLDTGQELVRGQAVIATGQPLMIPVGDACLGRVMDIFGRPHDGGELLPDQPRRPLFAEAARDLRSIAMPNEIIDTGIKAIDFFTPLLRGGKTAIIGGAGVGKTVILTELSRRLVIKEDHESGVAVFSAVGERSREARELYEALQESNVLPRTTLLLGQMGESPAVRFRTAYAGATVAEYFRDEQKKNVLYYMDNLYRFTQAGHELATIANTTPSEDGYQATLTSEMASLNERLHSTTEASITSFMALFVPADDFTDAGVRAAFSFLDTAIFLSRDIFQSGRYPAIDFLDSTSAGLAPAIAGTRHYLAYIKAKQVLEQSAQLERIVSLVGEAELSLDNQKTYRRAGLLLNYMTQDLYLSAAETGHPAVHVSREETIQVVEEILAGKFDTVPAEKLRFIDSPQLQRIRSEVREAKLEAPAPSESAKKTVVVADRPTVAQ